MAVTDRRKRERAQRRQGILAAATRVFAQRGVDGASMDAIASEAELGKATLYYYFRTKEELYSAVLAEGTEQFFTGVMAVKGSPDDLAAMVEALLRRYTRFCCDNPALMTLMAPYLASMHWTEHTLQGGHPAGGPPAHPAAPLPIAREELPRHQAFIDDLRRQIAASPWAGNPDGLLEFLNDIFVALAHKHLAGRPTTAEQQVALYVQLIRDYRPAGEQS